VADDVVVTTAVALAVDSAVVTMSNKNKDGVAKIEENIMQLYEDRRPYVSVLSRPRNMSTIMLLTLMAAATKE